MALGGERSLRRFFKMELYTATYHNNLTRKIDGFDVPVTIPDQPPKKLMRNYGLPIDEQIFRKEDFPEWSGMAMYDKIDFVNRETHKRFNGEWWIIKGEPVYVNGWAYFYFNYWWAEWGGHPNFRMEAIDFFHVWDHCFRDKDSFGMMIIKGRRVGDTEKSLCVGYDTATRYRNSWFGMQNLKDDDAQDNFLRVVEAHKKMAPWFKPVNQGSDSPKHELVLDMPANRDSVSMTGRENSVDQMPTLSSRIDYKPTKTAEYDGKRLRFYHMDEPGKLNPSRMKMDKQWAIIRPTLSLYNEKKIIGKAIFTTTVENLAGGETIEVMTYFWEGSNPAKKQANGRTETGLYRYYRNFRLSADVDKWGHHKVQEAEIQRESTIASYMAKGDLDGMADYKRKFPDTIDDALSTPAGDCPLFPTLLDMQMDYLRKIGVNSSDKERERIEVRGDLTWSSGQFSKVVWTPNPSSGKWFISRHPVNPNNNHYKNGKIYPGNGGMYTMGVDAIDHYKTEGRRSDGAIAVYMPYNSAYEDPSVVYDGKGEVLNVANMITDQFVCVYSARPEDPNVFYDDVYKTMFYYSIPAFIERDKPGVINKAIELGLEGYLVYKPKTLGIGVLNEKQPGAKTSQTLTSVFVEMLKTHISKRIETYRHIKQLGNFRNFDGTNMNKCDLVVASGYALMDANKYNYKKNKSKQFAWTSTPW
jgi:hypothetical protein